MNENEQPFACTVAGECVRGIRHDPPGGAKANAPAILMLHGWSGCRLGPHRMFVKTARALSREGHVCLRIDFRGRGESGGDRDRASIAGMAQDAAASVAALEGMGYGRIALLGICSGAKVAITAATECPTVRHLVLWSGEAMGSLLTARTGKRKTAHALAAYARKALRPSTWRKLAAGRVDTSLVRKAILEHEAPSAEETCREDAVLRAFAGYRGDVLFVFGGNDPATRDAAAGYHRFCADHGIQHDMHEIAEANHSFYALDWEREVIDRTAAWLRTRPAEEPGRHA